MLKLEFKTSEVVSRSGVKNGKDWSMRTQDAWITMREQNGTLRPMPERFTLVLQDKQEPYEIGTYDFDVEASLYQGDFNALRLGRPIIRKVIHAQPALKTA